MECCQLCIVIVILWGRSLVMLPSVLYLLNTNLWHGRLVGGNPSICTLHCHDAATRTAVPVRNPQPHHSLVDS